MEIQTKRLTIIPCSHQSLSSLNIDRQEVHNHILDYLNQLEQDPTLLGWGVWFVIDKNNNVIGDIGFKGKPDLNGCIEVGYGFKQEFHNQGFATESVKELLQWAFSCNSVTTIKAECRNDNIGSIRVLEKLGMQGIKSDGTMLKWRLPRPIKKMC
ncbi:GNAT family N-acetyltransferase [Litchfieldia alkalitelluris]|uniref:GNAT family N-acetyltransferase n=1 Tax=Litchfieldia alkalitelluris TaxID=304268 RepID=UPI0009988A94|nr:GNAT family N-acetyltransferase [Litchfieldia alkalitelluris]